MKINRYGCYPYWQMAIKYWYLMLRLLPLPIFICIYLFSWWRCKKNIIASDKQLKPCIDWAYIKNLPLPPKPSFVEFYIVYVSSFFKFPFGIIIQQLPFAKKVRYYEREMKLIFDKWNLEKIKKINNLFIDMSGVKIYKFLIIQILLHLSQLL